MNAVRHSLIFVFLGVAGLCAVMALQLFGFLHPVDRFVFDQLQTFNQKHYPKVVRGPVIVGLDEAFLKGLNVPLSLTHFELADGLRAMSEGKASVIGMDLVLPEKRFDQVTRKDKADESFHKALLKGLLQVTRQTPLVTGKVWDAEHHRFKSIQIDYLTLLKRQKGFSGYASALICADSDGRVRVYPGAVCQPDGSSQNLALEMAQAMHLKTGKQTGLINYQLGQPFSYIPMNEVLEHYTKGDKAWLEQQFEGKPVLVGSVLENIDGHFAPVPLASWLPGQHYIPGVLIHGQILRSLMANGLITPLGKFWAFGLTCFGLLAWFGRSAGFKFGGLFLVVCATLLLDVVLLQKQMWFAPSAFWLLGVFMALSRITWEGFKNLNAKQRLRSAFGGYVSPPVLDEILQGRLRADQQGEHKQVCVLFSDVRGFTTLSESLPAAEVVSLLNQYFARMTRIVHKHGGTVDKFIGDGLMAFFGSPNKLSNASENAAACALEMIEGVKQFNAERAKSGKQVIEIGVGLHYGEAIIGHIGSEDRNEYTAIGDTVNVASRVEGLCKSTGKNVLCTATVAENLSKAYDLHNEGQWPLKGHSDMTIYSIDKSAS